MKNLFKKNDPDTEIKKSFDGVEINTTETLTVADAIRLKENGLEFKGVTKGKKGRKTYTFKRK